jgi:quinoprotein glucose dehydrogenase
VSTRALALLASGCLLLTGATPPKKQPYTTWSDYGGAADSMQYSALRQIDKRNVGRLKLAWTHKVPTARSRFGFNPIVVDRMMYVLGDQNAIMALDAVTGKPIWSHPVEGNPTDRGINYWESPDRKDRRLIFSANSYLQQINALTGVTINTFGKDGRVDLREDLPRARGVQSGTPGRIWQDRIIMGSAPGEGYGSAPGDLRAYDVRTGKRLWTFHTIPRPGEFGYETWPPDAWKYVGGANAWGEISIDEKRGIGYFPLGSPTFDLYGGDRKGDNLFGNCLLALDLRTGKRLWHFQTVHHDLWDYDLTTAPKLLTVTHKGKKVDIVAQPTKFGLLYVFNRETGEPLWPIEERPVPQSDTPGEQSSKTQPFPTKPPPFARLKFPVEELNPYLDPEDTARLKDLLLNARNEGIFTPASHDRNAITIPGELGGSNWGGSAADPTTGMLYVRTADQPAMHQLRVADPRGSGSGGTPAQRGRAAFQQSCEVCHGEAEAGGIRSMDRATVIPIKSLGDAKVRSAIREGRGQMPAFPDSVISNGTLTALLTYLNDPAAATRGRQGPPPPPPPPPPEGVTRYTGPLGSMLRAKNGLSAIGPPWAQIVAYDLNEGTIKWRAPLGSVPALVAKGITGTGNNHRVHRNGPVVTAGGLIFIGTSADRTVRAYDKDTGKILWEQAIEAAPEGLASVYQAGGKQFVVFCASGVEPPREPTGNIAFVPGKLEAQGYYVFTLN